MSSRKLLSGVLAALASIGTGEARARVDQSATEPTTAKQSERNSASPSDAGELETIVVTARKRDEALEEVPVAVSVLDETDRASLVLDGMGDYLRQSTGALLVNSGPDYLNDISIRGQGGGRNGFSDSATGIYRNGIFVAGGGFGGRSFNRLDYFDAETVEVYRGPQGALYGRNSIGGSVNVVTRRPQEVAGGSIRSEYTDVERRLVEAVYNLPLTDRFFIRAGGLFLDQDGGDIVRVGSGEALDTQTYRGARVAFRALLGDDWEATLTQEYYSADTAGFSTLGQRLADGLPPGRNVDPGRFLRNSSRLGRVGIEEDASFLEVDGTLSFADVSFDFARKSRDGLRRNEDLDHFLGLEGLRGVDLAVQQGEDFDRVGAELRLTSIASDVAPLAWLAGMDWQRYESDVLTANSGTVPATSAAALRAQAVRRDSSLEELRSYSVFGALDYRFAPRWNGSVEARLQRDRKDFRFQRVDLTVIPVQTAEPTWTRFLPGATLSYSVAEGQRLYTRFASGYRSGGFNSGVADLEFLSYEPEDVRSFEIGYKGRLSTLPIRFDVAAYFTPVDDLQLVTAASASDTTTTLQNARGAEMWGLEAEISGRAELGSGSLSYRFGVASQDGEFDDGAFVIIAGRRVELGGKRVNRTRDYIANLAATYEFPLFEAWSMYIAGSVRAENGGFENATGSSGDPSGRRLEDFTLFDLRLGLRDHRWDLSIWGKNLGDETYTLSNILSNLYYNERRRFGITLRRDF
jgi:outer membrane receptor protein involved in Fe transport